MNECNDLNGFLTKAVGMVKRAAMGIQSEYSEIDDIDRQIETIRREKSEIEGDIKVLEDQYEPKVQNAGKTGGENSVEPPQEKDEERYDGDYEASVEVDEAEKEEFRKGIQDWEDEVEELDHQEVRMLNKVRKLENIVENTNLILNYIENHGSIHLSQLDNYITNQDQNQEASKMAEIDDLCLNSSNIRNKNPSEKYELITKDMTDLRKKTDSVGIVYCRKSPSRYSRYTTTNPGWRGRRQ